MEESEMMENTCKTCEMIFGETLGDPGSWRTSPITTGGPKLGESLGPSTEVDETSLHVRAKTERLGMQGRLRLCKGPCLWIGFVANSQHARVRR